MYIILLIPFKHSYSIVKQFFLLYIPSGIFMGTCIIINNLMILIHQHNIEQYWNKHNE